MVEVFQFLILVLMDPCHYWVIYQLSIVAVHLQLKLAMLLLSERLLLLQLAVQMPGMSY